MLTDFFTTLTQAGTSFVAFIKSLIEGVSQIIYTPSVDAGVTPGSFTTVGIFVLIMVAAGLFWVALRWVMSLIRTKA